MDIDDLFKKNKSGIENLFKNGALKKGQMKRLHFSKDDAIEMMNQGVEVSVDGISGAILDYREKETVIAYGYSKMTIGDEMKDIEKYNMMNMPEFYEFLGRWAELLYVDQIPLI